METFKSLPDAVQWSEGMLLSPQHLQQNDIYWHEQMRYRLAALTPHYWGVRHLRLDSASLVKEIVSITALDCVLPDGLAVVFDNQAADGSATALSLDVATVCRNDGRPVRVWLRVRERGAAASKLDNEERRYDYRTGISTVDENTGDGALPVGRLRVRMELYAAPSRDPGPAGSFICPLLELVRDAQHNLTVTQYYPPMLHAEASEFLDQRSLLRRCERIREQLWAKLEQLAGGLGDEAGSRADSDGDGAGSATGDPQHLAAARELAACLPRFDIALSRHSHPADLYAMLAQVVGQVARIGGNPLPLKMKPYIHENCAPQFSAVFEYIERKLALVDTTYECLRFSRRDDGVFSYPLSADGDDGEIIIELQPHHGQKTDDVSAWLSSACIASDNMLATVQQWRLLGAQRQALTPAEIKARSLRPLAALFFVRNLAIDADGSGAQEVVSRDLPLLIQGALDARMPAAIVLHRKKQVKQGPAPTPPGRAAARRAAAPVGAAPAATGGATAATAGAAPAAAPITAIPATPATAAGAQETDHV